MTHIIGESFADYLANPALGSGQAKLAYESMQLLADDLDGLTDRGDKPAYGFGRAFHALILEPDSFRDRHAIKPPGMKFSTREGKAWRETHRGKEIISSTDMAHMAFMQERMPGEIATIFQREGLAESTLRIGFRQARLDWLVGDDIYDIKTIDSIGNCERDLDRYGYWLQQGWYELLYFQENNRWPTFTFVFAEKRPPYRWQSWRLDPIWRHEARAEAERLVADIQRAYHTDTWLDTDDIKHTASMPPWLERID